MSRLFEAGKVIKGRYEVQEKIGEGSYGNVFRVLDKEDKKIKAMKVFKKALKERKDGSSLNEIEALKLLKNTPGLPHLEDNFFMNRVECIVFALYQADLDELRQNSLAKKFLPSTSLHVAYHSVKGLAQLHQIGVLHRDLKLSNMMVPFDQKAVKLVIVDFGMSCRFLTRSRRRLETPQGDYRFDASPYSALRMAEGERPQETEDLDMLAFALLECRNINPFFGTASAMTAKKRVFVSDPSTALSRADAFLEPVLIALIDQTYGDVPKYEAMKKTILSQGYHINPKSPFKILEKPNGKLFMN